LLGEKTMKKPDVFKGDNTHKDYVAVRCEIVHVRKKFVFFTEKQLGCRIVIPNTKLEAAELMAKFLAISDEYGERLCKIDV